MRDPARVVMEVNDVLPSRGRTRSNNRRVRLFLAFLLSTLLLGAVLSWVILRFALPQPHFTFIGTPDDFPTNSEPYLLSTDRRFFIVNTGDELFALSNKSPHEVFWHCAIKWMRPEGRFMEPCGGSQFALDGSYVLGPSPRAMYRHPLLIKGDQVWVDTTRVIEGESHQ